MQLTSSSSRAHLMVTESAAILKRFHFLQRELVLMQAGWLPGTERWETKLLLPELLWEDALGAQQLRQRVLELRYPDRRIVPGDDAGLLDQWRSFRNAPDGAAFAAALPALKQFLRAAFQGYLDVADALDDGPTVRILREAIATIDRQLPRLDIALDAFVTPGSTVARWRTAVATALATTDALGLLDLSPPPIRFEQSAGGARAFAFAARAARDPRFPRQLFAWPDRLDHRRGAGEGIELQLRVAVHHLNEVWAAEMAAAVLFHFADEAPPEFLEEAARWCYDEIRHCRMGYARLRDWGFADRELPLDSFSFDASAEADPLVRLGTIYYFETTYIHTKSERTRIFTRTGDRLSAHDMDFDWADELIHSHYGSKWLKHFIEARKDPRTPEQIKAAALGLVRHIQSLATPADHAATEETYRRLIARARSLAMPQA